MPITSENILLVVDVQTNNQRLVELQKQLLDNRAALSDLNASFKDGKISSDDLAAGMVRLKQEAANVGAEQRVLTAANNAQTTANKTQEGSIEQLRAQLKLSTDAYNKLGQAARDTTPEGQKLQANTKAISEQLTKLEKAAGDARRSVGDYNTGVKDVNVVNGQLTGGLRSAIDTGLAPFRNEIDKSTGVLGKFKTGHDLLNQGLAMVKGSGESGALGLKAIAGGIALTGIGLFVIAISAMVGYFTQTAEGGRILAGVLGGLGSVIQVAADAASTLGKTIYAAITGSKEALSSLVEVLENQVVNRFKAFGVIFNAIRNGNLGGLTNGFLQLGTGVEDVTGKVQGLTDRIGAAYTLGQTFAGREKDLAKARREMEKEDAQAESRVAVLLRLSREHGKAAGEQLDSLKQAGIIENKLSDDRIKQAGDELTLVNDRIQSAGAAKKADLIAEKQAKELEIIAAESNRNETNARVQVRESLFREELRKAGAAASQKEREDAVRAKMETVLAQLLEVGKGSAAELVLLERQLDLRAALEIASAKKTSQEKANILRQTELDKQVLAEKYAQKEVDAAKKRTEEENKEVIREYKDAERLLNDYLADKTAALEQSYATGLIGEAEYQRRLLALRKAGLAAELVNAKEYGQDQAKLIKEQAAVELLQAKKVAQEKLRMKEVQDSITDASLQAGLAASDAVIGAFNKETTAGRAALAIKKTLALAEIAISVEKQLASNALTGAKIADEFPPLSLALGPAYTAATDALAIAAGLASAAKILGFSAGGLVPGAGSGDTVPALLTPGEIVMTKAASTQYAPVLSYLNAISGGVNFSPGFAPPPVAPIDGGLSARSLGGAAGVDYKALAAAMAMQPISVDVRAIAVQQGRVAKARSLSTLGS